MRFRFGMARFFAYLAVVFCGVSTAQAQFWVRELNTATAQLDEHYETYMFLTNQADYNWLDFQGYITTDDNLEWDVVDNGGNNGGNFAVNEPPFEGGEDYAMEARAIVTIPAGRWQIAFGSDDGGQLTLGSGSGGAVAVPFIGSFGQNLNHQTAGSDANQIWFVGNRGHAWTGGTIQVDAPTKTILHGSFHERGGGDSWELAIRDANSSVAGGFNGEFQLLENNLLGWKVAPTEELPARKPNGLPKGPGAGGVTLSGPAGRLGEVAPIAGAIIKTTGDGATVTPGVLNQVWVNHNNSGNLIGNLQGLVNAANKLSIQDYWWTGNAGAQGDIQNYPEPVKDSPNFGGAAAGNQESYTVWMSGEINLPAGDFKMRHGVDDYKYLAIDLGGNGTAGDEPGEVLYDDNAWVNWDGTRGQTDQVKVAGGTNPTAGWKKIEFIMSEGGGGDAGTLYWDVGNKDTFPHVASFNNEFIQDEGQTFEDYLVPADALRSVTRGNITGVELQSALNGATVNIKVSSDLVDADHVQLRSAQFPTQLDVNGATVNVSVLGGPLVPGDKFVPFDADTIIGQSGVIWNLPGGNDKWDLSGFAAGTTNRIIYTGGLTNPLDCNGDGSVTIADADCNCDGDLAALLTALGTLNGDADGDKQVQFPDFVILANNFGKAGTFTKGDFDCDGTVQFPDFVILANNFGKTGAGAAAAVPEPSSLTLIGLAGLMLGFARRRRS